MKKTPLLATAILTSVIFSIAHAQSQSAEASPQFESKPKLAAEALKRARPTGVAPIRDGSTGEGSGSGLTKPDKAAREGQQLADQRAAHPHAVPQQGGTPK